MKRSIRVAAACALMFSACAQNETAPIFDPADTAPDAAGNSAASTQTTSRNAAVAASLPLADERDFEDARRGLVASDPDLRVTGSSDEPIWDMPAYGFVDGDAPASVNPSLWRQAKLTTSTVSSRLPKGFISSEGTTSRI